MEVFALRSPNVYNPSAEHRKKELPGFLKKKTIVVSKYQNRNQAQKYPFPFKVSARHGEDSSTPECP